MACEQEQLGVVLSKADSHLAVLPLRFDGSVLILGKSRSAPLVKQVGGYNSHVRNIHVPRPKRLHGDDDEPPPTDIPMSSWGKRAWLFSRFSEGIILRDRTSWFSVTPEPVAKAIAKRCSCDTILDLFAGAGGNAIQFAMTCGSVFAVEIDRQRIADARHNAGMYDVADKIEFICGDAVQILSNQHVLADVVFLSPPWGGPGYQIHERFSIRDDIEVISSSGSKLNGVELFEKAKARAGKGVAYFLPRNVTATSVALELGETPAIFELHTVGPDIHTVCAYFGDFT